MLWTSYHVCRRVFCDSKESCFSWNYVMCSKNFTVQSFYTCKVLKSHSCRSLNPQQPNTFQLSSTYNSQHVEKVKVLSLEYITITHHGSTVVFLSLMSISSVHCTQSNTVYYIQHSPRYTVITAWKITISITCVYTDLTKIVTVYLHFLSVTSQTLLWLVPQDGDNIGQAVCRISDTL
jgi:hypothetical protein